MGCMFCTHGHTYGDGCLRRTFDQPRPDPVQSVVFHLSNGGVLRFDNVDADTISPVGTNPGVIAVEFANDLDRIVHVPFVEWWEIHYF